jgi:hypothetical protein
LKKKTLTYKSPSNFSQKRKTNCLNIEYKSKRDEMGTFLVVDRKLIPVKIDGRYVIIAILRFFIAIVVIENN